MIGFSFRLPDGADETVWQVLLAAAQDTLLHPDRARPGTSYTSGGSAALRRSTLLFSEFPSGSRANGASSSRVLLENDLGSVLAGGYPAPERAEHEHRHDPLILARRLRPGLSVDSNPRDGCGIGRGHQSAIAKTHCLTGTSGYLIDQQCRLRCRRQMAARSVGGCRFGRPRHLGASDEISARQVKYRSLIATPSECQRSS